MRRFVQDFHRCQSVHTLVRATRNSTVPCDHRNGDGSACGHAAESDGSGRCKRATRPTKAGPATHPPGRSLSHGISQSQAAAALPFIWNPYASEVYCRYHGIPRIHHVYTWTVVYTLYILCIFNGYQNSIFMYFWEFQCSKPMP